MTPKEQKINIIREANGEKTAMELGEEIGCSTMYIYELAHKNDLPLKEAPHFRRTTAVAPPHPDFLSDFTKWSPERWKKEREAYIEHYMRKGFSRLQALQIIEEMADWLLHAGEVQPVQRHPAIYDNPSREELIDKILKS